MKQLNSILFALTSTVLLLWLVTNISSCTSSLAQNRSNIFSLLQKNDFNGLLNSIKQDEKSLKDPVINLFASVASYFNGDYKSMTKYRDLAFSINKDELNKYIKEQLDSIEFKNPINSFISGIYLVKRGNTREGLKRLVNAKKHTIDSTIIKMIDYNIIILTDTTDYMLQNVYYIKSSGMEKMLNDEQIWGPFDTTYKINVSNTSSQFGLKYLFSPNKLSNWGHIIVSNPDSILTYYLYVTGGELVVFNRNTWLKTKNSKTIAINTHSIYDEKPIDYFGKCKLVTMKKKGQFYALTFLPSFEYSNGDVGGAFALCDSGVFSEEFFRNRNEPVHYFGDRDRLIKYIENSLSYGRVID